MSITATSGRIIIEFAPTKVHGAKAANSHLLRFSVAYHQPQWEESEAKDVLFILHHAKVYLGTTTENFLGFALGEYRYTWPAITYQTRHNDFFFELMLTKEQLEYIETQRLGGDINFKLEIKGEVYDAYNKGINVNEDLLFHINQSDWITCLTQAGYGNYLVYELDVQAAFTKQHLKVIELFHHAKKHLYLGHYSEVVSDCRKIIEGFIETNNLNSVVDAAINEYKDKAKKSDMPKEKRLALVLETVKHYTHPSHHFDQELSFSREDALFVIGTTASLISAWSIRRIE